MTKVKTGAAKFNNKKQVLNAINSAYCRSDAQAKLNIPINGTGGRILDVLIEKFNIDVSHFDRGRKNRKYVEIEKECPVCKTTFHTLKGHSREKSTCSYACSNTFFRSGVNNGSYKDDSKSRYHTICWRHHEKKCVICGENKIVAAHHYNGDHSDNRPENFVPLCPTHHQYWHSKYRHLIEKEVNDYIANFIPQKLIW